MERWNNKVALVTGASSGIGMAIVEELLTMGMKVIGFARRMDKMKLFADKMQSKPGKLYPFQVDLGNSQDILKAMQMIEKEMGTIDILVNNAAVDLPTMFTTGTMDEWKKTMDVNVLGLVELTKLVLTLKKKKGTDSGLIININDIWGYKMPITEEKYVFGPYVSSKFALRGITESLRLELAQLGSNIRVTSISPGLVETEMTMKTLKEHPRLALKTKDIAHAVLYVLSTPDTVQIKELMLTPLREMM